MKKDYFLAISLFFISFFSVFGQDCLERSLSDDTICVGQNASIILSNSETTMTYQLRIGAVNVGSPITGTGGNMTFSVSPSTTTVYSIYATNGAGCNITYADVATVTVNASTVGGAVIFPNGTNKFTDCHSASGQITLNGHTGSVIRWESSTNAGSTWANLGNAGSATYTYSAITATTLFRAVIQNASCTIVNSASAILFVIPNIKPSPISASPSTICEGESATLISNSSFSSSQNIQYGGLFNTANPAGWLVDAGPFSAAGDNGKNHEFLETNGNAGSEYDSSTNDKFAIVRGNLDSKLQTPVFDLIGLATASLRFDHAHKLNNGAWGKVELSFDGGVSYPVTLATYSGNQSPYNKFTTKITINLDAYLGYSNLRMRFNFHGTEDRVGANDGSTWAIDNVEIPQTPDPLLTSKWQDLTTNAIISVTNSTNVTVSPLVTTTYAVTSYLNGCTSYGPEGTTYVTITVNARPTANIGPNQTICYGGTANISIALTGNAPWIVTYSNGTTPTTVTTSTSPYLFSVSNMTTDKTYTVTNLSDANCTVALPQGLTGSALVDVLTGTPGIWTGLVSTDWFDCKNWEQGLPSITIDAQIPTNPSGGSRMPVIDRTSTFAATYSYIASARDLIVASGASCTMVTTNNSELQISRNWRNSGTFVPGTGTVTFNGSTSNQIQTINLGIKTNEIFYNLTTNNSGGAKGISVADGFELTVSNNVSLLSGDIRLTGEAQLIQAGTAANPSTGSGNLLRDQQGQKNSFNYNYWSSPVSAGSNSPYSIGAVLKDGTDVTTNPFSPISITFGDGAYYADGTLTSPIKTSNRWLWSYNSQTPGSNSGWVNYYQWNYIGNTGQIKVGEGYTMKGTGGTAPLTSTQNYVFVGKPNSGTIGLDLAVDQTYLIGNPYPSALDADEFIKDNLKDCSGCRASANVFNGALYFWDHFTLSNNHLLAEYEGGYAAYTLTGGVVAIANDPLNANNGSTGTKTFGRYIPVAQGFFVDAAIDATLSGTTATVQGGTLYFKNSQRAFVRETSSSSLFMKTGGKNEIEKTEIDTRPKIRLGFDAPTGAHRQLLVGADSNTTNLFDIGYDAPMFDTNDNDMYWELSDSPFVIQAIPDFSLKQIIPLGLTIKNQGVATIKIDALENIPSYTKIYLFDNLTGLYHNIKDSAFL